MLASRLAARPYTRNLFSPISLLRQPCRTYVHSRFPDKGPGSSRRRERVERVKPRRPFPVDEEIPIWGTFGRQQAEPTPETSDLWEASRRLPTGDPEEGLRRLLLDNDVLVVTRQIEMLNIFVGFEQSNRYVISNELGDTLGYIAEEPRGILSMFSRQMFRTHRPFRALVMDRFGDPILWLRRPFAWINSRMYVQRLKDYDTYTPEGEPVLDTFGEVQQRWHLWRRRYDLFLQDTPRRILSVASDPQPEPDAVDDVEFKQIARIDEGLWAWDFTLRDANGGELASVNRAFRGIGREIFTDTGQYFIRFGPSPIDLHDMTPRRPTIVRELSLEERALVLAQAVNIDFDYFSRHSHGGGFGFPLFFGSWGSDYHDS